MRKIMNRTLRRLIYSKAASAWSQWWIVIKWDRYRESEESRVEGAGSKALLHAKKMRTSLLNGYDETLRQLMESKQVKIYIYIYILKK